MRRLLLVSLVFVVVGVFAPAPGYAQQSFTLQLGGFVPHGEDARSFDDVLKNNLDFLVFDIDDFSTFNINGEWEFPLNDKIAGSLGLGFNTSSEPSVYLDYVEDNRTEIEQELKLRVVPFTAAVRLIPFGQRNPVQPYIGAGVGVFMWRYAESGEFVDFSDGSVFRDSFVGTGAATGPVIFGGINFVGDVFGAGFDIRYQSAEGDLPEDQGFSGSKIDLGGWTYSANFKVRF
jgi:hypothetical protein